MHFNSDIHTLTYLSKNVEFAGSTLSGPQRFVGFCWSAVNSGSEGGYYGELIGIKGLNWLSKHFINREWIAVCELFIGGEGQQHLHERKGGTSGINTHTKSHINQRMSYFLFLVGDAATKSHLGLQPIGSHVSSILTRFVVNVRVEY